MCRVWPRWNFHQKCYGNWQRHFELSFDPDTARALHDEDLDVDTDFCAMCGHDWCSVRISKEIQEFESGQAEEFAWDKPKITDSLTEEQQQILAQRGVLDPAEIHRLASKARSRTAGDSKEAPACHSEQSDAEAAREIQAQQGVEQLVSLDTSEVTNIPKHDSVI